MFSPFLLSRYPKLSLNENTASSYPVTIRAIAIRLVYSVDMILAFTLRVRSTHHTHFVRRPTFLISKIKVCGVLGVAIRVIVSELRSGVAPPASTPRLISDYSLCLAD